MTLKILNKSFEIFFKFSKNAKTMQPTLGTFTFTFLC